MRQFPLMTEIKSLELELQEGRGARDMPGADRIPRILAAFYHQDNRWWPASLLDVTPRQGKVRFSKTMTKVGY